MGDIQGLSDERDYRLVYMGTDQSSRRMGMLMGLDASACASLLPDADNDSKDAWQPFAEVGIAVDALAAGLQREAAASFVDSWQQLMQRIRETSKQLA